MIQTAFGDRVGVTHPLVQAPVGSASCPALAAAVSEAGALGMLAGSWLGPGALAEAVHQTKAQTDRPFAVNLVLDPRSGTVGGHSDRLRAVMDVGVGVISFSFGRPGALAERARAGGAVVVQSVGSAEAAREAAGWADVLVAQGWEAGGHVEGHVSALALVPAVLDAAPGVPVLGAGGVGDGRGLAALLTLGAAGAWMGTRFLATDEAAAHPDYKARVVAAAETGTAYGVVFDGGWPEAPHRALRNGTVAAWERAGRPASARPGEGDEVAPGVRRYDDVIARADMPAESVDDLALYAGQSVGVVQKTQPAGVAVQAIMAEAEKALAAAGALVRGAAEPAAAGRHKA